MKKIQSKKSRIGTTFFVFIVSILLVNFVFMNINLIKNLIQNI